jgi:hypothetical protein
MVLSFIPIGALKFSQTYQTLLHLTLNSRKITKGKKLEHQIQQSLAVTFIILHMYIKA